MMDSLLLYKILKNRTGAEISASGNPAIMSDTLKNNPMNEMKVFGWSKQERTTGAQLFPTITPSIEEKNGITVEHMEHGKIHISGTAEKTVDFIAPTFELLAGTYTLSMGVNIDNTLMRCTLSTTEGLPYFDILNNEASKTETTEDNMILYLLLRVYGGKTIDITIQPMLNTGTSPLPWEPYTGGQPSPSPDYPQQIVSAGDGGEVEVTICGKNLFDGNTDISKTQYYKLPIQMKKGAKLTMSFIGVGTGTGPAKAYCHDSRGVYCGTLFYFDIKSGVNKYSSTIICMGGEERIYFYNTGFSQFFENMYDIQIEINGIATDYKPYYTPQSLSISTPTGLPAIPVDTDGNYTDADGQQWIADYVDFKRGKYVQNVRTITIDEKTRLWHQKGLTTPTVEEGYYTVTCGADGILGKELLVDKFRCSKAHWTNEIRYCQKEVYAFARSNDNAIVFVLPEERFANKAEFAEYLAEHPLTVMTYLDPPIERNLTQEEIQAYKALKTYNGTTIVENDAECYMEVSAGGGDALRAKKLALLLGD